jgi:general secretion pathway protein K
MSRRSERGGALLMVLWLTAALSAIAFGIAATVRNETDRAINTMEATRAGFLARGAIERVQLYMDSDRSAVLARLPEVERFRPNMPRVLMRFPGGEAIVEIIPESSKLSLNGANVLQLERLLLLLGQGPEQARETALAIEHWRRPGPPSVFDQFYSSIDPAFRAPRASFRESEELLLVRGVNPELFYGSWGRNADGSLVRRSGLQECVSVYGVMQSFDVNTVRPEVMALVGLSPASIARLLDIRRAAPILPEQWPALATALADPAVSQLRAGGDQPLLLRATARIRQPDGRLGQLRRTAGLLIGYEYTRGVAKKSLLRSWDNLTSDVSWPDEMGAAAQ